MTMPWLHRTVASPPLIRPCPSASPCILLHVRLLLLLLLSALCLLQPPACIAQDSRPSSTDGGQPAHPSATDLLQQLQQLQREREEWQAQKAAIRLTLTNLQQQLDGSDSSAFTPPPLPPSPSLGVSGEAEASDASPLPDPSTSSSPAMLTVQLVDPHQLFPASALPSVWQTLVPLLADNGIAGAIRVTIARLIPSPPPSSPPLLHQNSTVITSASRSAEAPSTPTPDPTSLLPQPPLPGPWSPIPHPPPHPSFPSLLSPPPLLPPYSPSTPPSQYQQLIRAELLHAYGGYIRDAFPHDHYHPLTRTGTDSYHMHLTLVDALDTLLITQPTTSTSTPSPFSHALDYLTSHLTFGHQDNVNVFETTIRVLGALLATHHLTNHSYPFLLTAATSLADHLLPAFLSPTGVPWGTISMGGKVVYNPAWAGGASTVAEVASIQMEFQYLSRLTGDARYEDAVDAAMMRVREAGVSLYPQFISVQDGRLQGVVLTLGARVDSLYECMLKQYLLVAGGKERRLMRDMWLESGAAILAQLVMVAMGDGTVKPYTARFVWERDSFPREARLFVAEKHGEELRGKMDHLVCFLPGVYALSAWHGMCAEQAGEGEGEGEGVEGGEERVGCDDGEWMAVAKELALTCVDLYSSTPTGLSPEIVQFSMVNPATITAQHQQNLHQHRQLTDEAARKTDALTAVHDLLRTTLATNASMTVEERAAALLSLDAAHERNVAAVHATLPPAPVRVRVAPFVVDPGAKYNLLRPETMESLFVLHRTTGEERWREMGWAMFCAFVKYARVEGGGYSGLKDVTVGEKQREQERREWTARLSAWRAGQHQHGRSEEGGEGEEGQGGEVEDGGGVGGYAFQWSNHNDHMESFFLSETLKYAWLLFGEEDELPLDRFVFNTEAHPLPVSEERGKDEEAVGYRRKAAGVGEGAAAAPPIMYEPAPATETTGSTVAGGDTAPPAGVGGGVAASVEVEGRVDEEAGRETGLEGGGEGGGGGERLEEAATMVASVAPTGEVMRDIPVEPSPTPPPLPVPPSTS